MARDRGTFNLSANFEPIIQLPLDSRMLVQDYVDLVDPSTWLDGDGLNWLFTGALVVVANDPSAGIYWLKDAPNYTDYVSWEKAGTSDVSDVSVGVINIGDGSAGIFAGYDSSGNILLRELKGAQAVTITQDGSLITIGIDASYGGQDNYGENIGEGDASIYSGKVDDALQFRELISDSAELLIDVSGNLVVFDTSIAAPQGEAIDGGVWITDIDPQGAGNVGDKIYSSDGNVLDYCLTDTSALTVSVLALPGHTNYMPIVTINDVSVSLSEGVNQPLWTGTYDIQYNFADSSITVVHEDGASWSTLVDADTPAVIQSADFINGYPGSQTELKENDTFDVSILTDVSIVSVEVDNFGAAKAGTYSVNGNNVGITITIADRGTSTQSLGLRLRVVKSTGSTSANYLTQSQGSVDGKDLVNLNNTYPTISFTTIDYPTGQLAIKSGEDASVNHTVSNYDSISYSSGNGQLTIANPTSYESKKYVSYLSGGYNINSSNFDVSANRSANDATSTNSITVWIANTPVTLTISNPAARLRSGGNDGTSQQSHLITINANGQRLLSAPSVTKDTAGTWDEGSFSFSSSATTFTRHLLVHDDMSKGTYNWTNLSGTNLAGIPTTVASPGTYVLGGFVVRTVSMDPFAWQTQIDVEVADYQKLSAYGVAGGTGPLQWDGWATWTDSSRGALGDTTRPAPKVWSASGTFTKPTTISILDKSATDAKSETSFITIQEGI